MFYFPYSWVLLELDLQTLRSITQLEHTSFDQVSPAPQLEPIMVLSVQLAYCTDCVNATLNGPYELLGGKPWRRTDGKTPYMKLRQSPQAGQQSKASTRPSSIIPSAPDRHPVPPG